MKLEFKPEDFKGVFLISHLLQVKEGGVWVDSTLIADDLGHNLACIYIADKANARLAEMLKELIK